MPLIASPDVFVVIVGPYPARADAIIPPAAVPEMAMMSTYNGSMGARAGHDSDARSMPEVSGRKVSATEVCAATTGVAADVASSNVTATITVSTTAVLSRGSISGRRQAAKRKNCGDCKD
jgi:hypothetical protein